jgi:uncharacterized repeat protein (TIGR04138 family)
MQSVHFEEILDAILAHDDRFAREAYHLVREALDHTQRKVYPEDKPGSVGGSIENRHVSGQQLLEGLREYALQSFGPMALTVLEAWGVRRCEDIGEIVFNLVDHGRGMFGKTEQDCREDFREGYDFREAFQHPFLPAARRPLRPHQMREA